MNKYKCKDCGREIITNTAEKELTMQCCKDKPSVFAALTSRPASATIQNALPTPAPAQPVTKPTQVGPSVLDAATSGVKPVIAKPVSK